MKKAYCCECVREIEAEEVGGEVIYPHRQDLHHLRFLKCPTCGNYTGQYEGERPVLPTKHIRSCRFIAHRKLDAIWKDRKKRAEYYKYMSDHFNRDFHWGELSSDEEADEALNLTSKFLQKYKG